MGRLSQYFAWDLKGLRATEPHQSETKTVLGPLTAEKEGAVSPQIYRATSLLEEEGKEGIECLSWWGRGFLPISEP